MRLHSICQHIITGKRKCALGSRRNCYTYRSRWRKNWYQHMEKCIDYTIISF